MSAINVVIPMPVINNISKRMSRLPMCAISCAITPRNSAGVRLFIIPRVNATDASRGVRPVANAFIELSLIIYMRGVGKPAAKAVFSTKWKILRYCLSVSEISCAPAMFNIIVSPKAHDISIQIAHMANVGIATDMVVFIASSIGATNQVNRNINAAKMHGNNATKNMVFMLLLCIWS